MPGTILAFCERAPDERVDAYDVPGEISGYVVALDEVGCGVVAEQHSAVVVLPDKDL